MKAKVRWLAMLIVAVLVAVFTVGYAFAWFVERKDNSYKITGASAGAYFDSTSADGSAAEFNEDHTEGPFVISNATHMRNLAVLQNTGRFGTTKYYFKIKDSVEVLDMGSLWLPPIGTDDNPFIGEFNGNGKTISNLKVTTDKALLTKEMYPTQASEEYDKFSQAVGLFGNTGESSNIRNFILHNPHVVVGTAGVNYNKYSTALSRVVGIAVGHVAGKCSSIGVRATDEGKNTKPGVGSTTLDVRETGYSTFNSILGELGAEVSSSVTGGGHTAGSGGSGASFGSSFDVEDMVRRLNLIKENKNSSTPSWRLPNIDTSSNYVIPAKGEKVPFSINDANSVYTGEDAKEDIGNNNVGYFLGNQNKIETTKELQFTGPLIDPKSPSTDWYTVAKDGTHQSPADSGRVPAWVYKFDGGYSLGSDVYTSQMGFAPLTPDEFDDLPQDVKDIIPSDESEYDVKKRFLKISLSTALWLNEGQVVSPSIRLVDDNSVWSYHGQISWMGKAYGEGFRGLDGNAVDENGEKYSYVDQYGQTKYYPLAEFDRGVMLPNSTIWFKPSQAGKVKIIMFSPGNLRGFALIKITRKSADRSNPFKAEITRDSSWNYDSDIELSQVMRVRLPKNVLFYYEYEIKQETIDAGNIEYMMVGENNGADFIYLDLGASAAEDTSTVVPDTVSAVDFIYDGVEIEQEDEAIGVGNFIVNVSGEKKLYNASKTSVYFDNLKAILKVVYVRLNEESGKHTGKTICLENSDTAFDTTSEVKATFATYVCPTIGGGSGTVSGSGGGTTNPGGETVAVSSVSISGAPTTMTVGGTATLNATVSPSNATNKTVSWSSSNSNIASVDSTGKVTAKAAGEVTITATAGGKSATATITVSGGAIQYHSGTYTLNAESSDSMVTNNGATVSGSTWVLGGNAQTVNLALNVQEGKVITISVKGRRNSDKAEGINVYLGNSNSGTKLGTIDLTSTEAEGIGTVQYTATADGYVYLALGRSAAGGTILSEITVTISDGGTVPDTPTVTGVTVTPETATVTAGKTTTLSANVTMSSGSYSGDVTWTSSDTSIAKVDENGVVTGVKAGTATITATAGGKSATATITVTGGSSSTYESWSIDFVSTAPSKNTSLNDGDVLVENALTVKTSSNSNLNAAGYLKGNTDGVLELKVEADAKFTYTCVNKNSSRSLVIKNASGEVVHSQTMDEGSHTVDLSAGTYTITFLGGECRIGSFALTY